jgi:hypothetical protein
MNCLTNNIDKKDFENDVEIGSVKSNYGQDTIVHNTDEKNLSNIKNEYKHSNIEIIPIVERQPRQEAPQTHQEVYHNHQESQPRLNRVLTKKEYIWRSCCMDIQPDAALFFVQIFILLVGLAFCMYKLIDPNLSCDQMNAYFFFFGTLLGWVKEAPKISSRTNHDVID